MNEPRIPLAGRIIGYCVVVLAVVGVVWFGWQVLAPILPSLIQVLVTLALLRYLVGSRGKR